ncbi:myosin-binding protein 7-like [Andrographis paniculata]|uniref:myosin-binding protein 7-like n=1 Tax=Andrographis paniculata TaxID=175694 RepID=UPI0021E8F141|nr:myosin-binding protein 7-like [Andrographis paniculata]
MASECSPPSTDLLKCCNCKCSSSVMKSSFSGTRIRSVKRKHDAFEEENGFSIPGLEVPQNARVEIGDECMALREIVSNQQQTIQDLISELEEERNASSSAANETLSMILRLQRDKAEIQMEAKQFKRFTEEKMAHDQLETSALEDLLYKREEVMQALAWELQAYKHTMISYGLTEAEIDGDASMDMSSRLHENMEGDLPYGIYPPIKCYPNESHTYENDGGETEIDKYVFKETPCVEDQNSPIIVNNALEETQLSSTHSDSRKEGDTREASTNGIVDAKGSVAVSHDEYMRASGEPLNHSDGRDVEIHKLYARLHALETGRESMRQTIISLGTEKAQMVLLKEIAQNFSKEISPARRMPVRDHALVGNFSFMSMFKWLVSLFFWRREVHSYRNKSGLPSKNVGLLLLLDQGPWKGA